MRFYQESVDIRFTHLSFGTQFLKELDVLDSLSAEETIRAYLVMRPDVKMPFDGMVMLWKECSNEVHKR